MDVSVKWYYSAKCSLLLFNLHRKIYNYLFTIKIVITNDNTISKIDKI